MASYDAVTLLQALLFKYIKTFCRERETERKKETKKQRKVTKKKEDRNHRKNGGNKPSLLFLFEMFVRNVRKENFNK